MEVEQDALLLNGVAATADEVDRTVTLNVERAVSAIFNLFLTARSTATAIHLTIYRSTDGGNRYARLHSQAVSAGEGTFSEYTASETVTGVDDLSVDVECAAATHLQVIVSATGGGAGDEFSLDAGRAIP